MIHIKYNFKYYYYCWSSWSTNFLISLYFPPFYSIFLLPHLCAWLPTSLLCHTPRIFTQINVLFLQVYSHIIPLDICICYLSFQVWQLLLEGSSFQLRNAITVDKESLFCYLVLLFFEEDEFIQFPPAVPPIFKYTLPSTSIFP